MASLFKCIKMAVIKYSALVEDIRGKLNGSTLRVSGGIGVIQNKPYRNPVGMKGVGDNTFFSGQYTKFFNRLYHQAVQDVAHNGNPFTNSVADIRDIIRDWGFVRQADNGTDVAVVATAAMLYYQLGESTSTTIVSSGLVPDPNVFTYSAYRVGPFTNFDITGVIGAAYMPFIFDISPVSPIVNYRLRQRVLVRVNLALNSAGNGTFSIPDFIFPQPPEVGSKFWVSIQLLSGSPNWRLSPRSNKISITVA